MKMESLSVLNHQVYQRVLLERRIMFGATASCVFCIALFVISVATTSWAIFDVPYKKEDGSNVTICLHLGIWGEWRTEKDPNTKEVIKEPVWIKHLPEPPKGTERLGDKDLLHYYRTQAVFSVVGLILMILGNGFALYSFNHHRYMYKRLTFGLLALVSMCVLVVVEVLVHSVTEWGQIPKTQNTVISGGVGKNVKKPIVPTKPSQSFSYYENATWTYGYSTYLAWIVFGVYLAAGLVFLIGGRKNKGSRAATMEFEEEDRPVNLGR